MISLIWAMDKNQLIGNDNMLPWHYKEDLKYFRSKIKNHKVILGDMTYESILSYRNGKPFPDSEYYVATLKKIYYKDCYMINDLEGFLKEKKEEEFFVIGGKTIYKIALPYADRLYITFIDKEFKGNVYFPPFDLNQFRLIEEKRGIENPELRFCVYERIA